LSAEESSTYDANYNDMKWLEFSSSIGLDNAYDIVGIYNSSTNVRTNGQGPQHAYLWQEGYQYRPGTLVSDVHQAYKCKKWNEGGE